LRKNTALQSQRTHNAFDHAQAALTHLNLQDFSCTVSPLPAGDGAESIPLPLYLLGLDVQERWTFAVDISPARDLFMVRPRGFAAGAAVVDGQPRRLVLWAGLHAAGQGSVSSSSSGFISDAQCRW
jgi:hypothetical protein